MNAPERARHRNPSYRQRWQQRQRRIALEMIRDLSQALISPYNSEMMLDKLVQVLKNAFGYMRVGVGVCAGSQLIFKQESPPGLAARPRICLPLDGPGLTTWACRQCEAVLVPDVRLDSRYLSIAPHTTRAEIVVPIIGRRGVLGVINVESDRVGGLDR